MTSHSCAHDGVVVVGGGFAGLLAALRWARAGHHVTVIEERDTAGGAIAQADVAGVAVNIGAEAFSASSGAVEKMLLEIGIAPQHIASPRADLGSRLVSCAGVKKAPRGGLLGIPARPLSREVRSAIGTLAALRAWGERFLPATYALRDGVSIDEYVRRRMGARVADVLVAPVVGGVHSADPRTLELAAIQPRLAATVKRTGSLAAAVAHLRPSRGTAGTAVRCVTPTMATIIRVLAEHITARGGHILTQTRAQSLSRRPDGTWDVAAEGPQGCLVLSARHLVLAAHPDVAHDLLSTPEPDVAALIPTAPASPVRLVALVLEHPALDSYPSGTGALVAPGTPGIQAKALTHASAKWQHVQEAAHGCHVVRLSYGRPGEPLPEDDSMDGRSPTGAGSQIIDLALRDASRILNVPLDASHLRGSRVITWEGAMRQQLPGHRECLNRLDDALRSRPTHDLELVGAWRDGTGLDAIVRADNARTTPTRSPSDARGVFPDPDAPTMEGPLQ